MARKVVAK
jgi:hypothetical protein